MGAFLAKAGHEVTLVDNVPDHVAAINDAGLRITGPIAEFTATVPAFTPETLCGTWDTIILATKAHHTAGAVRSLLPHLADEGPPPRSAAGPGWPARRAWAATGSRAGR